MAVENSRTGEGQTPSHRLLKRQWPASSGCRRGDNTGKIAAYEPQACDMKAISHGIAQKTAIASAKRIGLPTFVLPIALPISAAFPLRYIAALMRALRLASGMKTASYAETAAGGMALGANAKSGVSTGFGRVAGHRHRRGVPCPCQLFLIRPVQPGRSQIWRLVQPARHRHG